MKLWIKMSVITATVLLVSTGISGAAVIYHSARYNKEKTIENYEQQLNAAAYAVSRELKYEPLKNFSAAAANAYYHYVIKKYNSSMYILVEGEQVLCNLTPFDLNNPGDDRWGQAEAYHMIQKLENRHILVMGIRLPVTGDGEYKLVLVRDISNIYEDIRTQAFFYARIYLAAVLITVVLVFLMIKKALAPLRELQRAAQDISEGRLERRAKVHTSDEIGDMAAAFNGMAAQIENQVTELSLESERRRQMLGSLTHEMKTPMTSIMGYADSLLHVNLKEEQKESALQHIYTECGRMVRISSKLMSLIGMYDNDSICMEEVSVNDLFSAVAEMEENNLKEKNMTLSYSCHMDKKMMDKDLMISLLTNLVDNAVRASKTGSDIIMEAKEDRITVRDFGCGIPEDEISRVTEAFYMVDKARSRKAGGCGLGLALCGKIAELHGAKLMITSRAGEGTEVSVVFGNMEN
ncbi:MAG: HAMP domain-containing histidine kinase [Lachnospiraceae bacterium]|nr:HAMP domain-containing histidine kinase [Lachnospiraceae bacterium]